MTARWLPRAGKALALVAIVAFAGATFPRGSQDRLPVPEPTLDPPATTAALQTAVLAGGCFWGVEAVFEHVKGVREVVSGYAGGSPGSANYADVSSGATRHAEVVRISYDPKVVSYGQLLKVFFSVAHDPTQLDRQGPDRGRQYRSAIFAGNPQQQRVASAYIAQMAQARVFGDKPIVTTVSALPAFHPAEEHHQDFARRNPRHPYIVVHDAPKVVRLQRDFPALYSVD